MSFEIALTEMIQKLRILATKCECPVRQQRYQTLLDRCNLVFDEFERLNNVDTSRLDRPRLLLLKDQYQRLKPRGDALLREIKAEFSTKGPEDK
jgi:hypothetical protein